MGGFSYLSVLLSIIIGLAVTQILQGFRARMLSHAYVQRHWPTQAWAAILLLIYSQTWWAMFELRDRRDWQFDEFLVLLAQTIAGYLLAGLVFPDFPLNQTVDPAHIISSSGGDSLVYSSRRSSSASPAISCSIMPGQIARI